MKHKYLLYAALTIFVMVSCKTSAPLQHHRSTPDNHHSELIAEGGKRTVEIISAHTAEHSLADRLKEILAENNTLLQYSQLGLHIIDLTSGQELFEYHSQQRMRPASTEKVVTAIAALDILGPAYTLNTQLLSTAELSGSVLKGDLYIKGVMDPLLSVADVRSLASQLHSLGIRRIQGRLIADASFKDSDNLGWGWCWDDDNPTLSPLLCGGKPELTDQLKTALRSNGIAVARGFSIGTAPEKARPLATITRPLTEVLQPMLKESDNLCAEAVFYQIGPTRKKVAATIEAFLQRTAAINNSQIKALPASTIADGSGLSLYNYQSPALFTHLLNYAATRPDSILTPLLTALPIAAVDGTLKNRMSNTPAAANVRAKTGSVSGVSTLVGYTTQRSTNHLIAFAIMNQGIETMSQGRRLQDQICIVLSE
ncbi:MAG: D-alanyl-D-alanine carboxypeptidase/D-alanyl-D-alanine-endopeptidase [Bacteroidales bacterium]|nr:D-alanyl-D-alanine carboxypeptidase/D-alanyl-D-alanine-endopeptidase [Bacteroidales bacterium]